MKSTDVTAILRAAKLPGLNSEQLLALANIGETKEFELSLRLFAGGEQSVRTYLELIVRSLSSTPQKVLANLGYAVPLRQLVELAKKEKMRLFQAIHAVASNAPMRDSALAYLEGLGMRRLPPAAPPAPKEPVAPPYYSFKIHGKTGALCIGEARTRQGNLHTVQIEGAGALGGGQLRYDWPNKIIVQLQTSEAYLLLALLEQKIGEVKFDGHGVRHNKTLQVQFQDTKYFVRMTEEGKRALTIPIRPVDAIPLIALLYKQLRLNEPHLDIKDITAMVDRAAAMMVFGGGK